MTFLQEELGVAQASLREKNVAVSFIHAANQLEKHSAQVRNLTLALEGFTRQRDNELAGVSVQDIWFIVAQCTTLQHLVGCLLSTVPSIESCQVLCCKVERTAEARVAREQKRAAEQEEAARCNHNHEQHDDDHKQYDDDHQNDDREHHITIIISSISS